MNRSSDDRTLTSLLSRKIKVPLGLLLTIVVAGLVVLALVAVQLSQPPSAPPGNTIAGADVTVRPTATSLRAPTITARAQQSDVQSSDAEPGYPAPPTSTALPSAYPEGTAPSVEGQSSTARPSPTETPLPTIDPQALAQVRQPYLGIWLSAEELARLPTSGPAWEHLQQQANRREGDPKLRNQDQDNNVLVLAKALVYARTGDESYREEVLENLMDAIGTEEGGRTLALGRELVAYVIAADLINLPADEEEDEEFRAWLRELLTKELDGSTLQLTQEERPNNWGTHAGASRAAVALYLQDDEELERTAVVFKGYLGDRSAYNDFIYGAFHWQADPDNPVGINPKGAMKDGYVIDGAMPEEMRRGGDFRWPPEETGYPWEALQGSLVQAEILCRAGYPTWEWEDRALLRAAEFLYGIGWVPEGDDEWQPWLLNNVYDTGYPTTITTRPGKNMGWTEWTHSEFRLPRGQQGGC